MRSASLLCLVLITGTTSALPQSSPPPQTAELEALIEQAREQWQVPGVAVAIVRGEGALLTKGFGFRDLEKKAPVTEKTLFRLASVTKSFTAAGVAALVTQGKLQWDEPVREAMPEFRLYNDHLTAHVTPVDLLSHRTGLPRHDAIWYYNREWSREDLIGRLRYMEPSKDLRAAYQYNNFMFLTAGYLTGHVLGRSWEDAISELIFQPLSMTTTNISIDAMERSPDHAAPYIKDKQDVVRRVPNYPGNNIAPAGQINSNAQEMGRYLTMLMNGGRYQGRQILAVADVQKMTSPQMPVGPADPRYPELGSSAYGLGLTVTSYRGQRMVHHGGALDGFRAHLVFLPDAKLGVVVLSNLGRTNFVVALSHELLDRLLGAPDGRWIERYLSDELTAKAAEAEAEKKGYSPRRTGTKPSHALAEYAGHYEHPGYGAIKVEHAGGQLQLNYGYLSSALNHYHYDSFEFTTDPTAQTKLRLRFETDADGEIASASVPFEPLVSPIVFTRAPEPRMRERSFLEPLTGRYTLGNAVFDVVLRADGALLLTQPSGQSLALEPVRGAAFRVRDRAGWKLEFKQGAGGAVTEAVLHTPGSSSVLKRTS